MPQAVEIIRARAENNKMGRLLKEFFIDKASELEKFKSVSMGLLKKVREFPTVIL